MACSHAATAVAVGDFDFFDFVVPDGGREPVEVPGVAPLEVLVNGWVSGADGAAPPLDPDPGVVLVAELLVDEPRADGTAAGPLLVPARAPAVVFVEPPQPTSARPAPKDTIDSAQAGRIMVNGV
jgi:hypothetical protein